MTIANDFDSGISSAAGGGDLCAQWPPLVRALQSVADMGVAMDSSLITIARASGNVDIVSGTLDVGGAVTFDTTLNVVGAATFDTTVKLDDTLTLAEGGTAQWALTTASGTLTLTDSGAAAPLTIENGAAANCIYVAAGASPAVGIGVDPGAVNFRAECASTLAFFQNSNDADMQLVIDSGSTTAQDSLLTLADQGTGQWFIRKNPSNNFEIAATDNDVVVTIEQNAPASSLYINSDGSLDFDVNPRVKVQDTVLNVANASFTALQFTTAGGATESYDIGSWHDGSTNPDRFTCPATGIYVVNVQCLWDESTSTGTPNSGERWLYATVGGVIQTGTSRQPAISSGDTYQNYTWVGPLSASDVVRCHGYQNSGGTMDGAFVVSIAKIA